MKTIAALVATATLLVGAVASADFRTIAEAYEVAFENLRLPQSENGTAFFKRCSDCETMTLPANVNTRYIYNGEDLSLQDFRRMLARVRSEAIRTGNVVTVKHHLETDTLVSIKVTL